MRSGSVASGRMRLAMGLTMVGGALLIAGLLMVFVGEAQRLKSAHTEPGIVRMGEFLAVFGLGIGIVLLVAMTVGRADHNQASRDRASRSGRGNLRWPAAPGTRPRPDPADGWRSPPQDPGGERRSLPYDDAAGGWRGPSQDPAGGWRGLPRDPAGGWFGPPRTAGAGVVPQRALPSLPDPAEEYRPSSDDYADDGWHPGAVDGWDPGPAYIWNPHGEAGWTDRDRDWHPGGEEDWDPAPSWPSDDQRVPGRNDPEPSPPAGPGHGYQDAPAPGYLTGPQPGYLADPEPEQGGSPDGWSGSTQEKLDQIKDLYLTAEAIGEDALDRHFDQLSQRQRALIREYFERAGLKATGASAPLGGESAENGAPLPG